MKYMITNWKTSVPGIIAGIANILPLFGIPVPPAIVHVITTVAILAIGLFAKDGNVAGTGS